MDNNKKANCLHHWNTLNHEGKTPIFDFDGVLKTKHCEQSCIVLRSSYKYFVGL